MATTTQLTTGTRVYEPSYPDTLGTIVQESSAGDGWYFVHFDGTTKGHSLSIPAHGLRVATQADEERVAEIARQRYEAIFGPRA